MLRRGDPCIRDFAGHPAVVEVPFERLAHHPYQLGYAKRDLARPGTQGKLELSRHRCGSSACQRLRFPDYRTRLFQQKRKTCELIEFCWQMPR